MRPLPLHTWLPDAQSERPLPASPVRVLGIDLGTTTSAVAAMLWNPGQTEPPIPECIEIEQPTTMGAHIHTLVPSVVAHYEGRVWIGEGARRLRAHPNLKRNRDIFYECKNHMGIRYTYHQAPEGFRSAAEISGHILAFLRAAAEAEGPIHRTVITVPASFQVAQRTDTLKAAQLAGINLHSGDLLDEPVAAFLDYLMTYGDRLAGMLETPKTLLVFDFGGGTCDVAIFRVGMQQEDAPGITVAPRAVSRYYRVGGGDIDAAIVHEVLIPQLIAQEGWSVHDLDYDIRKRKLEPALLSVAERLKIGLCEQIRRLKAFGKYTEEEKSHVVQILSGTWPCPIPEHPDLKLHNPQLTATAFERVLEPYIDTDHLYTRETEYFLTCSVMAPIQDALDRAGLTPEDIDLLLLVGGSSLIPQVEETVEAFFSDAEMLAYEEPEEVRLTVARGAAYHALALEMLGRSLIQPVAYDTLALKTHSGYFPLIPAGTPLPFPASGDFAEISGLAIPENCIAGELPLRVTLVAGAEERPLLHTLWHIPGPVQKGEPLTVRVRMDENQHLQLELSLTEHPDKQFASEIAHPLTHIVRPENLYEEIYETEEDLRTGKIARAHVPTTLVKLARKYEQLGQVDKAIDYLKKALRLQGRPDATMLNLLGIYHGQKGDYTRQEKAYLKAFEAAPYDPAPLFNLAFALRERKQFAEAKRWIERALEIRRSAPYLVLYATILERGGFAPATRIKELMEEAVTLAGPVRGLSEWELGWLQAAARYLERDDLIEAIRQERQRQRQGPVLPEDDGKLPVIMPGIQRL